MKLELLDKNDAKTALQAIINDRLSNVTRITESADAWSLDFDDDLKNINEQMNAINNYWEELLSVN